MLSEENPSMREIIHTQQARITSLEIHEEEYQDKLIKQQDLIIIMRKDMKILEDQLDNCQKENEILKRKLNESMEGIEDKLVTIHKTMSTIRCNMEHMETEAQQLIVLVDTNHNISEELHTIEEMGQMDKYFNDSVSDGVLVKETSNNSSDPDTILTQTGLEGSSGRNMRNVMQLISELWLVCSRVASVSGKLCKTQNHLSRHLETALRRFEHDRAVAQERINEVNDHMKNLRLELSDNEKSRHIVVKYDALLSDSVKTRREVEDLRLNLSTSLLKSEHLSYKYDEALQQLGREAQSAAFANAKVERLQGELDCIVEIVRKDMVDRIISKNSTEDLVTVSSQLVSQGGGVTAWERNENMDVFMEYDWAQLINAVGPHMTDKAVMETKATIKSIKHSFDILSSRLFLECRARSEADKRLRGSKDDLQSIKEQVLQEVGNRAKLVAELQHAKQVAENESKIAQDAIKQAQYFQRKLLTESGHPDERDLMNYGINIHPINLWKDFGSEEEFQNDVDGLVLTPEAKTIHRTKPFSHVSHQSLFSRHKDGILDTSFRSGDELRTASESGLLGRKLPTAKKRKKFVFSGKGMFKGGAKKSGAKANSAVAPFGE
mmetsp:Transcript_16298/g.24561  ORF Transcript_16298/g.24561 Transcript_16298/m.24561 type:complete len:607 (-) Transcript_16298:218-2038(-)|eukprot:CAMPEP_0185041112 /NCGR_PEP_ID=MMETSP1103-20130426/39974_1 /TAXON_ID=36769 /ORGANISM="Paraphysomonas bandaiensis, Strain Caron Lab Isolate" /LENGTH=606 /DNA_ID=CAMNT_0027580707 /DNA_START=22 /DNA_END=1842 /DNA_ORIENTATION=+